jgi:hypothetical protein
MDSTAKLTLNRHLLNECRDGIAAFFLGGAGPLLVTQRGQRIKTRRAPRRNVTGH